MKDKGKTREFRFDDPIPGTSCPVCGRPVTYNGNYFCTGLDRGDCDWALSDEEFATPEEKHLFNVAYVNLMQARGEEPKVSALWLKQNGEPW